ncbi:MAG: DUF2147 domain-containing protein [Bradyrhizobium sp.]|uniref:DUF2147 domain-containing protein n=1 Tax=Bradyrhizobium sp. TaxID=376 RepID=UPI0025C40636|nr:DUF2147 domain-containing protein [Bradyrhizobium sp.]MBI5265509.1 DUF2147 domain-containing protein [Bradyrhizobium sp.]
MNKLTIASVALLLASSAAHAGSSISFEIEGQKIRIEAPRHCDQLSCITITAPGLSKTPIRLKDLNLNGFGGSNDDDVDTKSTPAQAAPPAPTVQAPAPQPSAQATAPQVQPPSMNNVAPATTGVDANPPAPAATNVAPTQPAPATVATAPQSAPVATPAPSAASATPIGVWATEENKGNVRIESCGANLCGYAEKTGEKILINMRPGESKWVGRIHDPNSGRKYDSTIALKGPNALRVQGCAFGGMFCGGQTWKRVS